MVQEDLNQALGHVIDETARKSAAAGFRRRGANLRANGHGSIALIEFQKSTKSSAECIFFTINLAVVYVSLLESQQSSLEKLRSSDAHLRQRIGMLMPGHPDKWWEIKSGINVEQLANEVSNLIAANAVPYLTRYLESTELVALWESGRSPGLTETQRRKYLEKLKAAHVA